MILALAGSVQRSILRAQRKLAAPRRNDSLPESPNSRLATFVQPASYTAAVVKAAAYLRSSVAVPWLYVSRALELR